MKIDESKFFKRKNNAGRVLMDQKAGWVFGGICRESKEFFMVRVPDRTKETLLPIIHKHIKRGTTIMSDHWKAYNDLQEEGFNHGKVCHKYNFVNPDDPNQHTQSIECAWRYAKAIYPDKSTSEELKDSHLQEYAYRKRYGTHLVHQLLHDIKSIYNWRDAYLES